MFMVWRSYYYWTCVSPWDGNVHPTLKHALPGGGDDNDNVENNAGTALVDQMTTILSSPSATGVVYGDDGARILNALKTKKSYTRRTKQRYVSTTT